jgi:hypothetical protein
VSDDCLAFVKLPSKNEITGVPRSLNRDQAARFSKGDVIPASSVEPLAVATSRFPPLTKSMMLYPLTRSDDVKVVGSAAGDIAEPLHAVLDFD